MVERALHEIARLLRDLLAALVEREIHLRPADDLADRGLGDDLDDLLRAAVVEDEVLRRHEVVLHRELDVDDVLVLGEHRRFLGVAIRRRVAIAEFDRAHLREIDELDRLDRRRQVPARAGERRLGVLAEAGDDAPTALVDDVEAAREPHHHDQSDEQPEAAAELAQAGRLRPAAAAAAAAAATEDPGEALIEVAPQLVEVGGPLVAAAPSSAAATPLGIVK